MRVRADERTDEFAAAVTSLADRHPSIQLALTGPWPAYSFTGHQDHEDHEDHA